MGYRSHGNLVFPSVYRSLYEKMCPGTSLDEWDDYDNQGYTILSFSGWKWYGSYPDVGEIESFMEKLQELYNDYAVGAIKDLHADADLDERIGQLPFEEMVKVAPWFLPKLKSNVVGTINMLQLNTYQPQDWAWGFNMQGEDTDDYIEKGAISDLGGYNQGSVQNMWGYEYGGQAWVYYFKTAADQDYFAKNFNKIKAGTDIKMDVYNTKRFEIILHSPKTHSLWDQSNTRAGTDLSDPNKSFALDNTQYDEPDLTFAIWDEYELRRSQGDIYEIDIHEVREASFQQNDYYTLELPEAYLEAVAKEYDSA